MRILLTIIFWAAIKFSGYTQDIYTSRKGSKFFPGHRDIVVTVGNGYMRYELFNHWYAGSYAELRQLKIDLDSLGNFNSRNDTISIKILNSKVKLIDKRFKLNRKIRLRKLCSSPDYMRKISFAYRISSRNNIGHFGLFDRADLNLSEEEFKQRILSNLNKKKDNAR